MFQNIRKLRMKHGLTQQQLADIAGTTQQNINNYENRSTNPGYDILIRMANYFGVSLDYLILDDSERLLQEQGEPGEQYTPADQALHEERFARLLPSQKHSIDRIIAALDEANRNSRQ